MKALAISILLMLCVPLVARADEDTRARARELADQGGGLYQEGRFAEAYDKLDEAYALVKAPTVGYWSARSLEALGRWVAAAERYREVTRLELPAAGAELHEKARGDAAAALAALEPRIPRLRFALAGDARDVRVTIDGNPVDLAAQPLRLDPGERRVVATRGDERIEQSAKLEEGRETLVELAFKPPADRAKSAPKPKPRVARPATVEPEEAPGGGMRVGGYLAVGLGGALVLAGAATGIAVIVEGNRLEDACIEGECSSRHAAEVDRYNALRVSTTVGLSVGGAGVALGVLLLLLPESTNVAAGPGSLSVRF